MQIRLRTATLMFASLAVVTCRGGKADLLPGLTYNDGKEDLEGRLLFLASAEALPPTNGIKPCFLYELDLPLKKLRRVT